DADRHVKLAFVNTLGHVEYAEDLGVRLRRTAKSRDVFEIGLGRDLQPPRGPGNFTTRRDIQTATELVEDRAAAAERFVINDVRLAIHDHVVVRRRRRVFARGLDEISLAAQSEKSFDATTDDRQASIGTFLTNN